MSLVAERKMRSDALANRDKIVAAARAVFAEQGASAPFDTIAQRAGVGNATLYRHFPNSATLHAAILERRLEEAVALLAGLEAEPDSWLVIEAFVRWIAVAPDVSLIDLMIERDPPPSRLTELSGQVRSLFGARIAEAAAAGVIKPDISYDIIITAMFAITQVGLQADLAPALRERFLQVLLDGITA